MEQDQIHTGTISTREWSSGASLLICPRCGAETLHHTGVTVYDRGEDAPAVAKTTVSNGKVAVDPRAPVSGNPSARRDGLVVNFRCESCGDAPLELTIAQHKGSTEIGWRYADEVAANDPHL